MSYIKSKSFKITSRFYVIYGDYEPIYVGYTNRTVKQRFKEHQKDKDFSEYENVEVKELINEKLSFDFTWNYEQTCKNADQVSLREGQLVQQYGTQDSVFQKADGGGQTWAIEKWFVNNNKDNPRFTGMSSAEIKDCLKEEKVVSVWLSSFIKDMKSVEEVWLNNFVCHMKSVEEVWLNNFVCHMKSVEEVWLSSFTGSMNLTEEVWLKSFIVNMKPTGERWLSSFISNMKPTEERWLSDFVNNMKPIEKVWLSGFVKNMRPTEKVWLSSFISSAKPTEERWLSSFVGHMKPKK